MRLDEPRHLFLHSLSQNANAESGDLSIHAYLHCIKQHLIPRNDKHKSPNHCIDQKSPRKVGALPHNIHIPCIDLVEVRKLEVPAVWYKLLSTIQPDNARPSKGPRRHPSTALFSVCPPPRFLPIYLCMHQLAAKANVLHPPSFAQPQEAKLGNVRTDDDSVPTWLCLRKTPATQERAPHRRETRVARCLRRLVHSHRHTCASWALFAEGDKQRREAKSKRYPSTLRKKDHK